jgi:pimeloyl-ACP methyl ester carboxylesterase
MKRVVGPVEVLGFAVRGALALGALALLVGARGALAQQACIQEQDTSPTGMQARVLPAARCGLNFSIAVPDPARCPAGGCGLILDAHGFAMSADIQDRNTNLRRLGNDNGFVVAQPTAAGATPSFNPAVDGPRIRAFMEQAIQAFGLNPNKIHMGGFSQGAGLSFDFVCQNSDLIASAAPIAGASRMNCFQDGPPVPVLQTNGVNDGLASFQRASATRDQILAGMGLQLSDGVPIAGGTGITQTRFMNARGQVFEFIQHDFVGASVGAGHCFPGSFETELTGMEPGAFDLRFACEDDQSLRIGEAQVKFYIENPRR